MDKIQSYINENIFSIGSKTSAREAANTMLDNSITSLLVKEENKYVGIITHLVISPNLSIILIITSIYRHKIFKHFLILASVCQSFANILDFSWFYAQSRLYR